MSFNKSIYNPVYFMPEAHVIEEITSTVWKSLNQEFLHVEKNLVGMDQRRASSTCTSIGSWDYEKGIHTFRLDEIRGEDVASALFKAIEKSRCIFVVLSKCFAHSRWCLDELERIMECRNQNGKVVLPVFYHVDPSDVRKQEGWYGEALAQHESRNIFGHKTQRWRAALREVGNLSGWHVQNGSEVDYIEDITCVILMRFSHKLLHVDKNLIGMDYHLEEMEEIFPQMMDSISNDVRMVGIYGLGGIGKTTIAKVLYNRISAQFMITTFIANAKEDSKSQGLLHLQKQLLHDILPRRKNFISTVDEGIHMIKDRLCFKKVLLVLDDVDDLNQLEALAGDHNWFGPGSRIIVTTRDKHLLEVHEVDTLYEAKKLYHKEVVELFCWNAFKQNHPKEEYETVSNFVVHYVNGLPLGLKVLGCFLYGKTIRQWESELHKLEWEPNQEIQCVLKRSYDELDCTQHIFLDVACFFNGEDKDSVTRILEACKFYAESGMRVLGDKCLISIVDNKIWMHDLLQQMGQHIVGQEFPEEPGKWSRLWFPDVGTEAIKGILLNLSIPKPIHVTTESFAMMKNLSLLKIYSDYEFASMREHSKVKLSKDFEFSSYELRYLYWQGYPLESLPSSFYAEDLVELDMCYSSLKQLWESDMLLEKLNTIRLSCCQHLIEIPDISVSAPNLEKLTLDGCSSLVKVHPSIGKLSKLILLNLKNCKKLRSFLSIINMEALEILNLSDCSELKKFPDIQGNMEHLLELYLASTAIEELPSSVEHLTGLVLLDLKRCKNLKSLPTSVCKLESLEYLFPSGCSKLENFPEMMEDMENLKELLLDGTSIEGLPSSIDRLKVLVLLNLRNCKNLVSLPKGMCTLTSLETLIVSGCSQLNNLPKNLGSLQHLAQPHADGTAITQPPDSIVLLRNLKVLIYPGCKRLAPTSLGSLFSFWLLHRNGSNGISLRLPSGFSCFMSFTNLDLSDCKLIEGAIPNSICSLISLKKLDLSRNDFLSTPAGISELTSLKDLRLGQYQSLTEIPKLPPSVRDIHPHNCTALLPGPSSLRTNPVVIRGMKYKDFHIIVSSTASVSSLTTSPVLMQKLFENIAFSIVFPGSGIPEWIWHQSVGSSIKIELPTDWYNDDFLGFALCSVLEQLPERIICHLNSDVFYYGDLKDFGHDFHWKGNHVGSEHVWLGHQPCSQLRLFQFNDPNDWNHIEISFEAAHRFNSSASNVVKKCGVCLIYTEVLEGIHPGNRKQLKSRGCNVVERSSDRAGFNRSGMDSSYSGSHDRPTNHPTLKLKLKL
ncbi:disease resistance protein RPV1 [Vitis vinifera]|uniref:disease resistance protein RPV1 n=1 Tax=Vitis vinifera TaxID=29760 RepID=UPI002882E9E5|nr:disease resistance protein RPV1 [Vitis vinifera]